MSDLTAILSEVCGDAFDALGLDRKFGAVRRSDRPDLADFQCNGAMAAAKAAKRNPREIASEIEAKLKDNERLSDVTVAGPGFLNLRVTTKALNARTEAIRADERAGAALQAVPKTVVIDFGGPNVAKPMHVGHLRSAVIGDTLKRLCRFLGHNVIGDAHLGDWGLQMGQLVVALSEEQPDLPYFDAANEGPFPGTSPVTIDDLARLYPLASGKSKTNPAYRERCQAATAELQAGRPGYRALLKHFIDVSVERLKVDYAPLNVSFDLWKGESDVDHLIEEVVSAFKDQGLAREDEGALIVNVAREGENVPATNKDGTLKLEDDGTPKLKNAMPPVMLVSSHGATGYHTTDLATILDRKREFDPDLCLYVVDQRQALHFTQVFRASDKVGFIAEDKLEHIGFGTVNGTDGKPFKTREGGTLRLADLNAMALDEAKKRLSETKLSDDIDAEEREDIAKAVALASVRFSDLQNTRTTNYVFDLERFTSFEGKTGPYMLYAAVRIKSLLRRAKDEGLSAGNIEIGSDVERALAMQLDAFAVALDQAFQKRMPHIVCEHVYGLAQAFSAFYGAHPIATEKDPVVRGSRLALCEAVLNQLSAGLDLLGIDVPERM